MYICKYTGTSFDIIPESGEDQPKDVCWYHYLRHERYKNGVKTTNNDMSILNNVNGRFLCKSSRNFLNAKFNSSKAGE